MTAHIQQAGLLSGRSATFMAVVGLHAVVIAALIAIRIVPDVINEPVMDVISIPPVNPPHVVPPEPRLLPAKPIETVVLPPVLIQFSDPVDVDTRMEAPVQQVAALPADSGTSTATTVTEIAHAATALQYQIVRPTDDYYPEASVMLQERGVAIVQVCIDATGQIAGPPRVQASSGYKRLDQAALRWAREALRFSPATVDGVGVAACKGFRVNFDLR